MGIDPEVYYQSIYEFIQHTTKTGKELTRLELEKFIKKTLKVKNPRFIVYRLEKMGYIKQEKQEIVIKFVEKDEKL